MADSGPRSMSSEYVFDNAGAQTSGRFGALEAMYDGVSFRHLAPLVLPGSRCLEVGGGSGSIALWMAERVLPHGRVLATDLDTRFLEALSAPNLEVRRHDIVNDPLEEGVYDVVHTRLVLVHLPERLAVIDRLVGALKPGGHLVLQEFDSRSMEPNPSVAPAESLLKTQTAMWDLMTSRGVDVRFGRELFPLLRKRGLIELSAEGHVVMNTGNSPGADLARANFNQLHDGLVASGRVTEQEFQADLGRLEDPMFIWPSSILWTVWGRKPF